MEGKTTEEFQQQILKTIKLKNTSVDIYYQQNVYCNFKSDRETPFSVSLNLVWQKIFLFYRDKSGINNIGEMFPNFSLSKQDGDNVYMYDVSTLDFAQVCAVFIKLAECAEQYFSEMESIVDQIENDLCTGENPRRFNRIEMKQLLKDLY